MNRISYSQPFCFYTDFLHFTHRNFYILFNLAVGGAFTGITDINKLTGLKDGQKVNMYIDWVKIL